MHSVRLLENIVSRCKFFLLALITPSLSSGKTANSIIPVCLTKREMISRPYMNIAMNTVFLRNLIPSVVITSAICLAFFAVNNIACATVAITPVVAFVCTTCNSIKLKTASRFMPMCIYRDFFMQTNEFINNQGAAKMKEAIRPPVFQKLKTGL